MSRMKDFIADVEEALWAYNFDVEKVSKLFGVSVEFIKPMSDEIESSYSSQYSSNYYYDEDYHEGGL